ncbi:transposase [Actinoallomurus sp. NPDC052274]|uniref:RNA-guided endonuclease InsQ/TnpB family protein n=1 Tax=Actinoallomurus sp. NPDC052274 TaxID=3155420 RepID=UPI00343B12F5
MVCAGGAGLIRAYKFLLRPTARQQDQLRAMLADHCSLYNAALQERRDAYRHASKTRITYGEQSAQLKEIRAFDPQGQGRWSFSSQQATLRRLDKAFGAFFRRIKNGDKPGSPRFKGGGHFDTLAFPKDGDGCRWDSTPHDKQTRLGLRGVGHVRVHRHRSVKGRVKTIGVKREGKRWYVILACGEVPANPLAATGSIVGIDMGTVHFFTDSNGVHVENPRFLGTMAAELAAAQQHLATFLKRTRHRTKKHRAAARKVAKLYAEIRRRRRVIAVDARNTSRTCPACGHVAKENRLTQARFKCVRCGIADNADHVGALNVLRRAGLVLCAEA